MPLPENPNLDDAREDKDPGNEFEQNEGQDTGNEIIDNSEPDVKGLNAASRASESSFTLNYEDGYAPTPKKEDGDGQSLKH
ncbi:hypothetical protein [Mucilaginibacter celer]|uniref:Uncharacterized protein n=1 Tax=Mucilaginibacter celer TaxID=2305508 RepID=A0A494VYI8_9SPHI|nr:hypothetical protein [Mucilaginibacter celer]AYL98540.1 hypothetical protein HYN43_026110 [Mucilaginibacter celer]